MVFKGYTLEPLGSLVCLLFDPILIGFVTLVFNYTANLRQQIRKGKNTSEQVLLVMKRTIGLSIS